MAARVVLQAEGLTKRFGEICAVDDLGLAVERGEVFGLLGPNGAGKTTTIRMLCGLLRPSAGRVLFAGRELTTGSALRQRIGICPQDVVIWRDLTCVEQLIFVARLYGISAADARQRSDELLRELGLEPQRDVLGHALSGGMKRRLNLALALVHRPELVVLDEPTAGLDPRGRVQVRRFVQTLARGSTVILTTHNMDEAERLTDRVAILDHGRLLELDTPERLKGRVGGGDVLEIELKAPASSPLERIVERMGPETTVTAVDPRTLVLRARRLAHRLPAVLAGLDELELEPGEVRLRQTTLEDVFVALTGRRLDG